MGANLPATPVKWHDDHHTSRTDAPFGPTTCWLCGRAYAKCQRKLAFDSREFAAEWTTMVNEERGYVVPLVPYRCRYCNRWHMATAKSKLQRGRAEKQRRKWLIERYTVPVDCVAVIGDEGAG